MKFLDADAKTNYNTSCNVVKMAVMCLEEFLTPHYIQIEIIEADATSAFVGVHDNGNDNYATILHDAVLKVNTRLKRADDKFVCTAQDLEEGLLAIHGVEMSQIISLN